MTDRVDEVGAAVPFTTFDGTPLQSVAKGAVDLGKLQDEAEKKPKLPPSRSNRCSTS